MNWQSLHRFLTARGYKVYSPGQHEGLCKNPYIVVALAGSAQVHGISTYMDLYEIMLYYPYAQYSTMEDYQKGIKQALQTKYPVVQVHDDFSAPYHDDDKKAYMTSITYRCYKRKDW